MPEPQTAKPEAPSLSAARIESLSVSDLNDLCDATDLAIAAGGGFGWVKLPAREILERYWRGVLAMPSRRLFAARLDGTICGAAQLVLPPPNNEAQAHIVQLTGHFVAPWARGRGLSRMLLDTAERTAAAEGFCVVNLDVRETMEAAISLYEGAGYARFGEHPFYARVDGRFVRGFYYTKRLGGE